MLTRVLGRPWDSRKRSNSSISKEHSTMKLLCFEGNFPSILGACRAYVLRKHFACLSCLFCWTSPSCETDMVTQKTEPDNLERCDVTSMQHLCMQVKHGRSNAQEKMDVQVSCCSHVFSSVCLGPTCLVLKGEHFQRKMFENV